MVKAFITYYNGLVVTKCQYDHTGCCLVFTGPLVIVTSPVTIMISLTYNVIGSPVLMSPPSRCAPMLLRNVDIATMETARSIIQLFSCY